MIDDVLVNKASRIDRCVQRIKEEIANSNWDKDYTRQDAVILNLQKVCEALIDMGMHVIRAKALGVPQTSRDAFSLLY